MPRKPTGNPPGRPKGSGHLADARRITVWLSGETYTRLEAYAEGRHYHRGDPALAACVRELLVHALACPYKQQMTNIPTPTRDGNRQIETITAVPENNYYEQIQTVPLVTETMYTQIETVPASAENISRQIEIVPDQSETVPGYDTTRYYLGKLCPQQHDYAGSGQSLRRWHNQSCGECERLGKREARAKRTKRQATA